ncbi:NAD-dependent DNA ligase LigA [Vibrio splendidus]|nr:NAD-dependent DNA ligase LigA [Vibrio splendidus]MCC4881477.1 NAD-dependent DNA ligase LigA [Vibrio splendidus]
MTTEISSIAKTTIPSLVSEALTLQTNEISLEQYVEIVAFANVCANEYYVNDTSIIPDEEYDPIYRAIEAIEALNPSWTVSQSPTQRVGDKLSEKFNPVAHKKRMLSLDNAMSNEMIIDMLGKKVTTEDKYSFELKLDGLAISLIYVNGVFVQALTRGDKEFGEDVTHTVKTIRDIPMVLNTTIPLPYFEVRGEAFMSNAAFKECNETALALGKKTFVNPRNAASGTIRQLDPKVAASRKLSFIPYGLGHIEADELALSDSHFARLEMLQSFGFRKGLHVERLNSFNEVFAKFAEVESVREDLEYEIDGVVIKVDSATRQEEIGYTNRIPRWAVARKFAAMKALTPVSSVEIQVGRSGILTPVGKIPPTFCGGVTISSITLHHFDKIDELELCIGDEIVISRRGDVIPHVESVNARNGGQRIARPTHCPECGAETISKDGLVGIFCSAPLTCPAQSIEAICHYVGKKQMNIDGVGEKMIQNLFSLGLVKNVLGLYTLTHRELAQLPRASEKTAQKALDAIAKSKDCRLDKFVNGLGIPGVGESTASELVNHFGTLDALIAATNEELIEVNDIGEITSHNIRTFFTNEDNVQMINGLLDCGITFQERQVASDELNGQIWVVTGSLVNFDKSSIKDFLVSKGAKVTGSVSKKTHVVLYGDKAGSKLTSAQALQASGVDIKILNEDEFMAQYA